MGQLPNNEIPENRAHLTQNKTAEEKRQKERTMFISITKVDDKIGAALVGEERDVYLREIGDNEEEMIFHEPMWGKDEDDYNTGEGVIVAIARTAGLDDDLPGSALERLVEQVFALGVAHGTKTERDRIIARVAG